MNTEQNEAGKLPDGWVLCTSKSNPGRKYYFNRKTGKSSWTQPQANEKSNKKHKGKNEKEFREKNKKEETQKKCLKRKSDGHEQGSSQKKTKNEAPTPDKQKTTKKETPTKPTPSKCGSSKKNTPEKSTPTKNLANYRLSQFRARLSSEAQDTDKSPHNKQKTTTKVTQTETKPSKSEAKSPNLNDTKLNTTQSPNNDSLQSMPSPSQFFTANKIISSMKAQLPEEYCDKKRPKDTFADIEQGICNQTSEYPFMKHPATPPQFSEASKLVCAINSKLTKVASKDNNVNTYTSANERLNALRKSLNSEAMETAEDLLTISEVKCSSEAMDVDCKEIKQITTPTTITKDNIDSKVVLVVDTNIFIHELDIIKNVLNSNIKGYVEQPLVLVPWRVVNELDRLKDINNCSGAVWKRARAAMDYLYKSLPENTRLRGQLLRDATSHIYPCESADDEILNCCLQQAERGKSVILLSNDKNLCSKALINNIKSMGLTELRGLLEDKPQETADPGLHDHVKHYEDAIYQLLANILENEMRAKYNNLWQRVLFKAPPWSLADVLQCLLKHWIAVFNEVFPRIEHLLTDLKNALASIENKDPKSLSENEVSNFKELCLEVAKKCQIIPEYMGLAKLTVERLRRDAPPDTQGPADAHSQEAAVKDAFESVWTVFSSYCAKLSSCLGVPHDIEDKIPSNDPVETLTSKYELFSEQITSITLAIKGTLSAEATDPSIEEHISQLESVFKESLVLISSDASVVNKNNLKIFSTKCRNMLQLAHTKFSQLQELLEMCKNTISNK